MNQEEWTQQQLSEAVTESESRHIKWAAMVEHWNVYTSNHASKLKNRARKGIPNYYREKAWKLFCNSARVQAQYYRSYYSDLVRMGPEPTVSTQIDLDLDRTFPEVPMYRRGGEGQDALRRLLVAYSVFDPAVGYCQGMSFIAAILLLQTSEEDAFWLLVTLMGGFNLRTLYLPEMKAIYQQMYVVNGLTKRFLPKLWRFLQHANVQPSVFVPTWVISLYTNVLPQSLSWRVLDVLFSEGPKVLYRVYLGLLKSAQDDILNSAPEQVLTLMRAIPSVVGGNQLIEFMFSFRLGRSTIKKLHQQYSSNPNMEFFVN